MPWMPASKVGALVISENKLRIPDVPNKGASVELDFSKQTLDVGEFYLDGLNRKMFMRNIQFSEWGEGEQYIAVGKFRVF